MSGFDLRVSELGLELGSLEIDGLVVIAVVDASGSKGKKDAAIVQYQEKRRPMCFHIAFRPWLALQALVPTRNLRSFKYLARE